MIGKAQIYSSDQSFNKIITSAAVKVVAVVKHHPDSNTLSLTSDRKSKNQSEEAKLSRDQISSHVDPQVLAQLKKIAEKATANRISVKNHASDEFFYAGKSSRTNFIIPDSQNHAQNIQSQSSIEQSLISVISGITNNFYFNTRSKTFGYSITYSSRPPPEQV